MSNKYAKNIATIAIIAAAAACLSYLESLLPLTLIIPLPGLRLGLSNVAVLVSVYCMGFPASIFIVIIRCLVTLLITGSVTSFFFSLAGGILSVIIMVAISRSSWLSIYGVSAAGAAAHNIGQILVSIALLGSFYTIIYLPYLLLLSPVTGVLTAVIAKSVIRAVSNSDPALKRVN